MPTMALRSWSSETYRQCGNRLPGIADHCGFGRLAMDKRHGWTAASASESLLRYRRASTALSGAERLGLGAISAIRQYPAPGQDHDGAVTLSVCNLLRRIDR